MELPETIGLHDVRDDADIGRAVLELNNAHAKALSWLDADRLRHLIRQAFFAKRIGTVQALLLAFDQAAGYDSPNFLWFRARMARFVYVDRVVVAPDARGRGHGRRLYHDLFQVARQAGHDRIVCEVNAEPPNPNSDAFHASLGFSQIGTGKLQGGQKTVSYLTHTL